jgi:hypothetical protein
MNMKWNWKEFLILAVLFYGAIIVSDWIKTAAGLANWGIVGTLVILAMPVAIIYYIWKSWIKKGL